MYPKLKALKFLKLIKNDICWPLNGLNFVRAGVLNVIFISCFFLSSQDISKKEMYWSYFLTSCWYYIICMLASHWVTHKVCVDEPLPIFVVFLVWISFKVVLKGLKNSWFDFFKPANALDSEVKGLDMAGLRLRMSDWNSSVLSLRLWYDPFTQQR